MKIACERCQSSWKVLIDRMMRCGGQWHYGLSGREEAVCRPILVRLPKATPASSFREREEKGMSKGVYSRTGHRTLRLTVRG